MKLVVTAQTHIGQLEESIRELNNYINIYQSALVEIADSGEQANPIHLSKLAKQALGWEETTADEFNK